MKLSVVRTSCHVLWNFGPEPYSFERTTRQLFQGLDQLVVNSFERLWRCFDSQTLFCLEMGSIL
ncbi:hypothetical protein GIB67_027513 [Kingdonia uniflora]|uniref:Uncharacterized protein n=1 Tax=Kingdonia uniflora TaxID=39325 RepID=A0A7J7MFH8_9MAGN|nr:hypothetical protein GIB67_027513 [Kingdonia uniflora]